ncbi:MFS transporter [Mangrovicoccus algicola]|uniref:MFS transporter n=1 Tax=Mangrovicoccus algicola TaxID=2771008 RepID=A0A8J6Z7I1_9RHOB|nr:MFS transporter [Mangrovicoccus algicola]MBE3637316.1 MFS transporter [Mangrovicoccus algicola]
MLTLLRDRRAIALLLAASLTILSNSLISPALPGIEARFAEEENAALLARLLVTAPSLMVALLAPFAGAMADRFGRRPQLLIGVALFALAGTAGLYLPSLHLVLLSRLVLGVSVALIMTAQTALVGDFFTGTARSNFMGLQISATNFGGLIFLMLAGWLAAISPVGPFVIYGVALLYLPLMMLSLRGTGRAQTGTAAAGGAVPPGEGEPRWIATLGLVVLLAALCFVCFYLLPTQAPYFLATLGHPEPQAAGLLMGAMTLAGGFSSLLFGHVRLRLGRAGTPALGFLFFAAGFLLFAAAEGFGLVLLGGAAIGAGGGLLMPTFLGVAVEVAPAHRRGLAAGAITTSVFTGQFLSPLVSTPLIAAQGYAGTFTLTGGLLILLAVLALLGLRPRRGADAPLHVVA